MEGNRLACPWGSEKKGRRAFGSWLKTQNVLRVLHWQEASASHSCSPTNSGIWDFRHKMIYTVAWERWIMKGKSAHTRTNFVQLLVFLSLSVVPCQDLHPFLARGCQALWTRAAWRGHRRLLSPGHTVSCLALLYFTVNAWGSSLCSENKQQCQWSPGYSIQTHKENLLCKLPLKLLVE